MKITPQASGILSNSRPVSREISQFNQKEKSQIGLKIGKFGSAMSATTNPEII